MFNQSIDVFQPFIERNGVVVLDGGFATELEFRGHILDKWLWSGKMVMDNAQEVQNVHYDYYKAGADIGTTASYQMSEYGFEKSGIGKGATSLLLKKSVQLCRNARDQFWKEYTSISKEKNGKEDFADGSPHGDNYRVKPIVAASCGCYGATLADGSEYTGNYGNIANDFEMLKNFHKQRIMVLLEENPDILFFETIPNLLEVKAICETLRNLFECHKIQNIIIKPCVISFCCKDHQHISSGELLKEGVQLALSCPYIIGIGINCTPPKYVQSLTDVIRECISNNSNINRKVYILCYPNSGEDYSAQTQSWNGKTSLIDDFIHTAKQLYMRGVKIIGGCCRIRVEHIERLSKTLRSTSKSSSLPCLSSSTSVT